MTEEDHRTGAFHLSAGGLLSQLQHRVRGPRSPDVPISAQLSITIGVMWLPLVVISMFEGGLYGHTVVQPLLSDVVPHARFLVAVPILLLADLIIDPVTSLVVRNFESSGLVGKSEKPRFKSALDKLHRARDSIWPDVTIVALAFGITWMFKPGYGDATLQAVATSWMWDATGGSVRFSIAGWWYLLISGPMFQVILFRWIWRFLIWAAFLYRVSRLRLVVRATHPDLAGGLGYLGVAQQSFVAVFVAFTTVASSTIAQDLLFGDETLRGVMPEIAALVLMFVAMIYAPLFFFTSQLFDARRTGLNQYGSLGEQLSDSFHTKWIEENEQRRGAELLNSTDPSAVADYTATYENVRSMRSVPANLRNVATVAGILAVPFLPLTLTVFSLQDMLQRLADALI